MTRHRDRATPEPRAVKVANRPQYALIEAAERVGFDLTEPLLYFTPSVWPDAKVKGDQWAIADGSAIAHFGSSTGSLADDRAMAFDRLTGLSDWAETMRMQPAVASTIHQTREARRQHQRLSKKAARLDVEAIQEGNRVLSEETLALVYENPFEAMVAMREMVGDTAAYQPVVDALKNNPGQFGSIRKRSALSVMLGAASDLSASSTLATQVIPDLQQASDKQQRARQARQSAKQVPVASEKDNDLVAFADALDDFNRRLIAPEFRAVEVDITAHKRFEMLVKDDPVSALELAQTKALSVQGSPLWTDIAHAVAETVRDDDGLAAEAEARGIIPEQTLPKNARIRPGSRPPNRPGPQPNI
ncbi:MAG: hypothetical protein AAF213_08630 [Pseudomonadota bacterium]